MGRSFLASILALGTACGSAHADRVAVPAEQPMAPVAAPSPYKVEVLGEDGRALPCFERAGRYYMLGAVGQRYTIRVTNPTARRVEAVVSVDGLDVIDGRTADFRSKRGYVVPAYGELRVDGWRTSTTHVAAFRFSSVSNSYAGRKGQDRNVGVVGVAIFEERAQPEIILEQPPPPPPYYRRYDGYDDYDVSAEEGERGGADNAPAKRAPAEPSPSPTTTAPSGGAGAPMPPPHDMRTTTRDEACCDKPRQEHRPGLGTEYGESRWSAVSWTRFERANHLVPTAIAEFRYNDAEGLAALGIRLTPPVSPYEVDTRETANPFPNAAFAQPPR